MRTARAPLLSSIGVLAAPTAWTLQLWALVAITLWSCGEPRRDVPVGGLSLAITAAAALVAAAGGASAVAALLATRDASGAPPAGRVRFLGTIGVPVSVLFGCLIVMTGIGIASLERCAPS